MRSNVLRVTCHLPNALIDVLGRHVQRGLALTEVNVVAGAGNNVQLALERQRSENVQVATHRAALNNAIATVLLEVVEVVGDRFLCLRVVEPQVVLVRIRVKVDPPQVARFERRLGHVLEIRFRWSWLEHFGRRPVVQMLVSHGHAQLGRGQRTSH